MRHLLGLGVGLGPVALLSHEPPEPGLVDVEALLGRHLEGEVDREAVRVVQLERLGAAEGPRPAGLGPGDRDVEDRRARAQRPVERFLLRVGDLADPGEAGLQLGVRRAHLVLAHGQQVLERRCVHAEQAHRTNGAADQPAQHVAPALVAGRHTVADQHERRAHVVRDDPEPDVVLEVGAVAATRQLLCGRDDGEDLVDLVEVVDALEQVGDALETQAGVDVALGQRPGDVEVVLGPDGRQVVLHEDEVPELQVPVPRLPVAVGAELGTTVDEDLRAGSTGTGHAHVPVVVLLTEAHDAVVGESRDPLPERDRLVVLVVDRGVQVLLVEPVATVVLRPRHELPGELDGALLEVVAEAEVAVHLEERAVPRRLADLLDVEGSHALLHARRTGERRRLLTEEVRLERHHPGVDEQEVGVLVHEWRARHDGMTPALEEGEPAAPDLGGFHVGEVLADVGG